MITADHNCSRLIQAVHSTVKTFFSLGRHGVPCTISFEFYFVVLICNLEWKATAVGKNGPNAKKFLEKRYNENLELEDAINIALLTLKDGFEGKFQSWLLGINKIRQNVRHQCRIREVRAVHWVVHQAIKIRDRRLHQRDRIIVIEPAKFDCKL